MLAVRACASENVCERETASMRARSLVSSGLTAGAALVFEPQAISSDSSESNDTVMKKAKENRRAGR